MSARRAKEAPKRRRWRRPAAFAGGFAVVALAVFAWTGLVDGPDESGSPPAPTTSTVPEPAGPRVLDPGVEPRRVLRLTFTAGEEVSFRIVTDLDITQSSNGQEQTVDGPAVVQTVTMTVDQVHDGGSEADFGFVVTEASVLPEERLTQETIDELNLSLTAMVGLGGSGRIADTGEVLDFEHHYDGDDPTVTDSLDRMADQMQSLAPTFPTAPLGVGARWVEVTEARLSGVAFSQTTTYELTDITDDAVKFTSAVEQQAEPQALDLADVEDARLVSYSGSGSGSGLFTLSSLVAAGTTSMTAEQVIALTLPGDSEVELSQDLTLEVAVDVVW